MPYIEVPELIFEKQLVSAKCVSVHAGIEQNTCNRFLWYKINSNGVSDVGFILNQESILFLVLKGHSLDEVEIFQFRLGYRPCINFFEEVLYLITWRIANYTTKYTRIKTAENREVKSYHCPVFVRGIVAPEMVALWFGCATEEVLV